MRLTIIGGSGPFTVGMFAGERAKLYLSGISRVTLQGRNAHTLGLVAAAVSHAIRGTGIDLHAETDSPAALAGADVVLVQARFGGLGVRQAVEEACRTRGLFADETLGVGGIATALCVWDAWQHLGQTLRANCKDALILNMINPLSLSSKALHMGGCKIIGLCEGPTMMARTAGAQLATSGEDLDWTCSGLNHRAFLHDFAVDGRPVSRGVLSRLELPQGCGTFDAETGAIISKEMAQSRDRSQWSTGRAARVAALRRKLTEDLARQPDAKSERPTPWYDEAVLPFLAAWSGAGQELATTLNVHEGGVFIERCYRVGRKDMRPIAGHPPSDAIAAAVARLVAHEAAVLACLASKNRDPTEAIATDPLIPVSHRAAAHAAIEEVVAAFGRQAAELGPGRQAAI